MSEMLHQNRQRFGAHLTNRTSSGNSPRRIEIQISQPGVQRSTLGIGLAQIKNPPPQTEDKDSQKKEGRGSPLFHGNLMRLSGQKSKSDASGSVIFSADPSAPRVVLCHMIEALCREGKIAEAWDLSQNTRRLGRAEGFDGDPEFDLLYCKVQAYAIHRSTDSGQTQAAYLQE